MKLDKTLLHTAGIAAALLCIMLLFISAYSTPEVHAFSTSEVHALMILVGDSNIRPSVEQNQAHMTKLLAPLSHHCTVHLTLMRYGLTDKGANVGDVTKLTYSDGEITVGDTTHQGSITEEQVDAWLTELDAKAKPEDTVLIYFNGYGVTKGAYHHLILQLDKGTTLLRSELRQKLRLNPCRLKLLITDPCRHEDLSMEPPTGASTYSEDLSMEPPTGASTYSEDLSMEPPTGASPYSIEVVGAQYVKQLFLEHEGLLDITATKPGYYAWSDPQIGGFFTHALVQSCALEADKDGDSFLTWEEVFNAATKKTEETFRTAHFVGKYIKKMESVGQTTQTPFAESFPSRLDPADVRGPGQPRSREESGQQPRTRKPEVHASSPSEVHALMILVGDDSNIQASVEQNQAHMEKLLALLSHHRTVHLTLMRYGLTDKGSDVGDVMKKTYSDGSPAPGNTTYQALITEEQVDAWLTELDAKAKPEDTVLIYFNGFAGKDRRKLASVGQDTLTPFVDSAPSRFDPADVRSPRPPRIREESVQQPRTRKPVDLDEMAFIPAGTFRMGTDKLAGNEEKPSHLVSLDAFYIDKYEVTLGEYEQFLMATLHRPLPPWVPKYATSDKHPVVGVSWRDAMAYATWAGKRLPTEAEWEYAARGGLHAKDYPWGDEEPDSTLANYGKTEGTTTPVGEYPPNAFGLYDVAGNVAEWCLDVWEKDYYSISPEKNPFAGPKSRDETIRQFETGKGKRVVRGGSFMSPAVAVRVDVRHYGEATDRRYFNIGFRCARDAPP